VMWLCALQEKQRHIRCLHLRRLPVHRVLVRNRNFNGCDLLATDQRTKGRTGILLYLSLIERRAEIVADEAIHSQVEPEVWGEAMAALIGEMKAGRPGEGMVQAVERIGAVLAKCVPPKSENPNELPDRLIEI